MNVDVFFDLYFNFLSTKTEKYKNEFNLINLDGLEAVKRQNNCYLIGNMAESYWDVCDLKNISTVFETTFLFQYCDLCLEFP